MMKVCDKGSDAGLLFLRVLCGLGIAYHGYGKIFSGKMDAFAQGVAQMGFPAPEAFAWMAALSEFAGGLLLAFGLATQLAALFIFGTMTVAAFVRHKADPFQVKELALAYWAVSGMFVLTGPGKYALDSRFGCCRKKDETGS